MWLKQWRHGISMIQLWSSKDELNGNSVDLYKVDGQIVTAK